jgi:hypothetical protein
MDGSKEDSQAGWTGNPYWGAAKKACDIDQYGAPPMDRLKDDHAEVLAAVPVGTDGGACGAPTMTAVAKGPAAPVVVPTGVPMATATSKGPATPTTGPVGALAPAARKRRPAEGGQRWCSRQCLQWSQREAAA